MTMPFDNLGAGLLGGILPQTRAGALGGPRGLPETEREKELKRRLGFTDLPDAPGFDNPGAGIGGAPFVTPPPTRQFLDEDRAKAAPPGYATVDEALAASLKRDGYGFAGSGPGGRFYSSNDERDRAQAMSANPLDQLEAFRLFTHRLADGPGGGSSSGPGAAQKFAQFQGLVNQGKDRQNQAEENLAKQYGLTTRGVQEDARGLNTALIGAKAGMEQERMRGDTARDINRGQVKGQLSSDKMKLLAPLVQAGDKEGVQSMTKLLGAIEASDQATRRPGGDTATADQQLAAAAQGQADAVKAKTVGGSLGLQSSGIDEKTKKEKFAPFNAQSAMESVIADPNLLKNQSFLDSMRKGNAGNSPDAIKQALFDLVAQQALPSFFGVAPDETQYGGLTVRNEGNARGFGGMDTEIIDQATKRSLGRASNSGFPLAQFMGGQRRFTPRFGVSTDQTAKEQQALTALMKAVHGIP
jgi:hypothetical protein